MSENTPAFTREAYGCDNQPGMSLRDWFAGQALIGMVSAKCAEGLQYSPTEIADDAFQVADAMLAERSKADATG